ncbi:unnamed protein product [Gadus morhua 'NCC']
MSGQLVQPQMEKTRAGGGPLIMEDTRAGPLTRALGPSSWRTPGLWGPHHGGHQGLGALIRAGPLTMQPSSGAATLAGPEGLAPCHAGPPPDRTP